MFTKLNISKNEALLQFKSHPDYPSALALSDTLNFLGIKNEAYSLEKEYWDELPEEFITIYQNKFVLVEKKSNQAIIHSDKIEKIPFQNLLEEANDLVILFETDNPDLKKTKLNKSYLYFIYGGGFLIALYNILYLNIWQAAFNLLSMLGIYILAEVIKNKTGSPSTIIKSVCGNKSSLENISETNGCNSILNSKDFNLVGLGFTEFGLTYFLLISLLGVILPPSLTLKLISFFSLGGVIYSLYYQFSKKTFCKVCGIVIWVLLFQASISATSFNNVFNIKDLFLAIIITSITFLVSIYLFNIIRQKDESFTENITNLRFKKNYNLFRELLLKGEPVKFSNFSPFLIGEKENNKISLTLITNPLCGYCKDAHKLVEKIYKKYPEDVSLEVRYNFFSEQADENMIYLIKSFKKQYDKGHDVFFNAIDYWYKNMDIKIYKSKFPLEDEKIDITDIINIGDENRNKGLNFTPFLLLNNYPMPEVYKQEDLLYFIDELIEDVKYDLFS